jgi:DNA-binding CsgD family transcriptional regulator
MSQKNQIKEGHRRDDSDSNLIGRFRFNDDAFRIVLLKNDRDLSPMASTYHEIARFTVRGRTLAIVEEAQPGELDHETRNMIARLTGRELQIAAMIAQGDATKNVAYKLRISEWTVGTHLRRIFAKLGVDNRAAMVYRCASLIDNATTPPEAKTQRTPVTVD